ncbi:lipoprotein [Serratia liquefaciens]|uniref:lipoprotein n=1 Tax=Serratia liquefaciens TaxID=614 RepID=UPI0021C57CE4|nr:lipoprotein [Serratia liquefaciens]
MRKIILAIAATAILSGCTTGQLENQKPIFNGHSKKTPQQYSKCLAPKWQAINSTASAIETETGYQIVTQGLGALSLVKIDLDVAGGSNVKVYAVSRGFNNLWERDAQMCL